MLIACWSPKGGSGTTVVATALALLLARSSPDGVLFADLGGDVPAVLGVSEPDGPGLSEWLATDGDVPRDALRRLAVDVGQGLHLLPRGRSLCDGGAVRTDELIGTLADDGRPVVVDCGPGPAGAGLAVAERASLSLLVLRPCYLALRRAANFPVRPSGVILVNEPGHSFSRGDVESVLGVPVRAEILLHDAIARAVDCGLLNRRVPRVLERALEGAA